MKKTIIILSAVLLSLASCSSYDSNTLETYWASTVGDVNSGSELKMFLLLEGDLGEIDQCYVLTKITDERIVYEIYDALDDARYICRSYDTFTYEDDLKAICFIDADNHGYIIKIDWDTEKEVIKFAGGYSEKLYEVLMKYGVIGREKKRDVKPFASDPELAKIRFAPMPEYIGRRGNLKGIAFVEGDRFSKMEEWRKLAEITNQKEIGKIKKAFSTAKYCVMHILEASMPETAMVFIYEDGRDEILIINPNRKNQAVEFEGGYSKKLYTILTEYGIWN